MADISQQTQLADSSPEDAADHIAKASIFNVEPSAFKQYKEELNAAYDKQTRPTQAESRVAEYASKSTEHAALIKEDVDNLNYLERQAKLIGDYVFNRPGKDRRAIDLSLKKMNSPDQWTEDDQIELDNVNFERDQMSRRNYGLDGPIETLPAKVLGGIASMVQGAAGESQSTEAKVISKLPFAGPGLALGYGMLKDAFKQGAGATYNDSQFWTDDQGKPLNLDESTRKKLAYGVGVVSVGLQAGAPAVLTKAEPFMGAFMSPRMARVLITNPSYAAGLKTVLNIADSTLSLGGISVAGEMSRIVAEEVGKTASGGGEAEFWNGLASAAQAIQSNPEYQKRLKEAALVGAGTGLAMSLPPAVLGFGRMKQTYAARSEQVLGQMRERVANTRDVTPETPAQIEGGSGPRDVSPGPAGPSPIDQSVKVLQLRTALENMSKVAGQTKMAKLAPAELTGLKKMIFESAALRRVWVAWDDFQEWRKDPKRAEAAKKVLDPAGVTENAPVPVDSHKFMELVRDFPEALDLLRIEPNGPSAMQATKYLSGLEVAHQKQQEVLQKLGIKPDELPPPASNVIEMPKREKAPKLAPMDTEALVRRAETLMGVQQAEQATPEEKAAATKELDQIKERIKSQYGLNPGDLVIADWAQPAEQAAANAEAGYLNEPTFTEAIRRVLPEAEVKRFDEAQMEARNLEVQSIQEGAELERLKVVDVMQDLAADEQMRVELERLENDPALYIVDKFERDVVTNTKGKKPVSMYAIDPKTLTDEQAKRYADNPTLKDRGVFVKGGLSPDDAARAIGVQSGEELLSVLSRTPYNREDIAAARAAANQADLDAKIDASVEKDFARITQIYNNRAALHISEMKFMREQKWAATKSGIKRIALPLPTIPELRAKARTIVAKTRVGDLNVQRYKVGERQAQRTAVNAILKNEVEKAFVAKESAALNVELQRESIVRITRANRWLKWFKNFEKQEMIEILKEAGPQFEAAANEVLDVFNLVASRKGTAERGAFRKLVKERIKQGAGDFSIPDELSDIRQDVYDMTSEQLEAVGLALKKLVHEARTVNRIYGQIKRKEAQWTREMIAHNLHQDIITHPEYKPGRKIFIQETKPFIQRTQAFLADGFALITNLENVVRELDKGKTAGIWQRMFMHPLKGDGEFNERSGYTLELKYHKELKDFVTKNIEAYGRADFEKLNDKVLDIAEFRDSKALNYGRLTKADLIVLWVYGGDPDGFVKRAANSGVTNETIQAVLDRELEERDVVLAQNMIANGYKNYQEPTRRLQEAFGQDVEFVTGIPNRWRNKEFPGGYIPNKHIIDWDAKNIKAAEQALEQRKAAIFGEKDVDVFARQAAAEMTQQGRLISREGSDLPLDLSLTRAMRGHEEVIHDLSYREVIRDALKLLREPQIRADIIDTVGEQKYRIMMNTYIEAANRIELENVNYFADQSNFIRRMGGRFKNNFNITVLGLNPSSVAIQYSAITQAMQNLGVTGPKHFAFVNAKMAKNLHLSDKFYEEAVRLDPTIGHFMEQLQNTITSTIFDLMPSRGRLPGTKLIERGYKYMVNAAMASMSLADVHIKMLTAHTAYSQFIGGDVPAYPKSRLAKMTPTQIDEQAQAYVRQISRLSLTHGTDVDKAPVQKHFVGGLLANYWNDARNTLNNQINQGRSFRYDSKESFDELRNGNYKGARSSAKAAAGVALGMVLSATMYKLWEDWVRGKSTPIDHKHDWKSAAGIAKASKDMTSYMLNAPLRQLGESSLVWRDIDFAMALNPRYPGDDIKPVNIPLTSALTNIATAANGIAELLTMDRYQLSDKQMKAALYASSITIFPMPVNGAYKLKKLWGQYDVPGRGTVVIQPGELEKLKGALNEYKQDPPKNANDETLKQVDELIAKVTPASSAVSEENLTALKRAASGGDWTKIDPATGAAGIYQFTEKQWRDIKAAAPELGLTDNGRIAQDPAQQEKAMKWQTERNAQKFVKEGIPVDDASLYGAHLFGIEKAVKLWQAAGDTKAKTILSDAEIERIGGVRTVGQARKAIKTKVGDKQLTAGTTANED